MAEKNMICSNARRQINTTEHSPLGDQEMLSYS